jgi:hypothetical protein
MLLVRVKGSERDAGNDEIFGAVKVVFLNAKLLRIQV